MRRRTSTLVMLLASLALLAPATLAEADANDLEPDGDAPDKWEDAWAVEPGRWNGTVDAAGDEDWYRIDVPAGHVLIVQTLSGPAEYRLIVRDAGGHALYNDVKTSYWAPHLGTDVGVGGGPVYVGFMGNWIYRGNYTLSLQVVAAADVHVDDVEITHLNGEVDALPGEEVPSPYRRVIATVSNTGFTSAPDFTVQVWADAQNDPTGNRRVIGTATLTLAPGASRTLTFAWDTTGMIGDVTVTAAAIARLDSDQRNNALAVDDAVHARGVGFGMDALNAVVRAGPVVLSLDRDTGWGGVHGAGYVTRVGSVYARAGAGEEGVIVCATGVC